MYLHIGNDVMINTKELVGIFDIENSSTSQLTKEYLNFAGKMKRVKNVSSDMTDMPKSFVVCIDDDLTETVYISPISCLTLRKRFFQTGRNRSDK